MSLFMQQRKKATIVYLSKILIPVTVVISLFLGGIGAGIITFEPPEEVSSEEKVSATLVLDFGDGTRYSTALTIENATVFDVLLELEKQGAITIETTYWESFDSYSVDSIIYKDVAYAGDAGHYWAFYVNGEASMQGADKVYVHDNDVIEWKFVGF